MKWLTDAQYVRVLKDLAKERSEVLQNCTATRPLSLRLDDNDDGLHANIVPGDTIDITVIKTGSTQVFLGLRFKPGGPKHTGHAVTGSLSEVLPVIKTEKGTNMLQALGEIWEERGMVDEKKAPRPWEVKAPLVVVKPAEEEPPLSPEQQGWLNKDGDLHSPEGLPSDSIDDPIEIPDELIEQLASTHAENFGEF